MNRRILAALLLCLAVASPAIAVDSSDPPTPWWFRGLTFHAPFDDPASPLKLIRGTGSLTFSRVHDTTHTATYVHPGTGLVTEASADQLRIEANGALVEGARTNILLRSRTLNNAAWTAISTTADNTITGRDGVDNSASWVAASGSNGTICQAVTIASAAYSGSVDLKRIAGTGTVKLSLDGGSTWGADVAGSLSSSAWYRAIKENQTLVNPSFCIQLGTSGDNVSVDYAQVEAGAFASSRIPTTTVAMTRSVDIPLFDASGNVGSAAGTVTATFDTRYPGADYPRILSSYSGGGSIPLSVNHTNGKLASYDRVNFPSATVVYTAGTTARAAVKWSGILFGWALDGTLSDPGTFDGSMDAGLGTFRIGNDASGPTDAAQLYGHIKNLRIWNRAFTDAELQNITK